MRKILLTGAYGFVGTNLSKYLADKKKYTLCALDQKDNSDIKHYTEFFNWDEIHKVSNESFDVIIHLAGKAHDTENRTNYQEYFDINVGLTQSIFDQFLISKATTFIFFSSVKAVADTVSGKSLDEDDLPNPLTPYGQSKLAAEKYILSKNIPSDKKVFILRPAMIHGPGNKGNLNLLYKFVKSGIPYPLGRFDNQRSFASIENINYIIENLIEQDIKTGIYHVADSDPISTSDIVNTISKILGRNPRIWNVPKPIINFTAQIGGFLGLSVNQETIKKLTETYIVSNKKILNAIQSELPNSALTGLETSLKSFDNKQQDLF